MLGGSESTMGLTCGRRETVEKCGEQPQEPRRRCTRWERSQGERERNGRKGRRNEEKATRCTLCCFCNQQQQHQQQQFLYPMTYLCVVLIVYAGIADRKANPLSHAIGLLQD